jgi:glycosyltransferase involved in cell wall biosynthesis
VKKCLTWATVVTAPSRYLMEQMRPYRADIRLLPNPLNLSSYRFSLREQPQPQLIWLRAFHEIYNPLLALKVVALLTADFPDIRLTIIGPDKRDGSLQRLLQLRVELGLADHVTLLGGVPNAEVPGLMHRGDIFLNTTNVDNTPVSVLEAMACGLCVVSTNVGGIPYLLEHEHDALLVPPDDPAAMATALCRILTEPGLAKQLSRNARRKVEQFDWSVILPQWEALLTFVGGDPT